jgi:gliding motility-associated-like protein
MSKLIASAKTVQLTILMVINCCITLHLNSQHYLSKVEKKQDVSFFYSRTDQQLTYNNSALIYSSYLPSPEKNLQKNNRESVSTTPFSITGCGDVCINPGFENPGEHPDGWVGAYGKDDAFAACTNPEPCNLTTGWDTRPASRAEFDQHVITTTGTNDRHTNIATVPPGGGNRAFRLGDLTASDASPVNGNYPGEAARASLTFTVTPGNTNFIYRYAVVLEDPPFPNDLFETQRPYFQVRLKDANGNVLPCGALKITAKAPYPGLQKTIIKGGGAVDGHDQYLYYSNWTTILVPLEQYIGQCVTIEFTTSDAANGKYLGYAYIDADCNNPFEIEKYVPDCRVYGVLTAPEGGAAYQWQYITSNDPGAIDGASDRRRIGVYKTGTYEVTITPIGGGSCKASLRVTVNLPDVVPTIEPLKDLILCTGSTFPGVDFGVRPADAIVTWENTAPSVGLPANGIGNIGTFLLTNSGQQIIKSKITVKSKRGLCNGVVDSFNLYVLPQNLIDPALDTLDICAGNMVRSVNFVATNPPVTWTNSNTAIGLAASGNTFTPAFEAKNPEVTNIKSNIVFTIPPNNGCPVETRVTYPITIKPTPVLSQVNNIIVCAGSTISPINFNVYPPGAEINWVNSDNTIGLPDKGKGNIKAFTANSSGDYPVTATLINVPTLNGCTGNATKFDITVNPLPNVDLGPDIKVKEGVSVILSATTTPDVISYNWTPAERLNCSDCPNPLFSSARDSLFSIGLDSLTYRLDVTSSNGCTRNDLMIVRIEYTPCNKEKIFIPNIFTPNNDGLNDIFYIQGTGYGKVKKLTIFDRWGSNVFEKTNFVINDRNGGWNGRSKNQQALGTGTYIYYAIVECNEGNLITLKGSLTLLR